MCFVVQICKHAQSHVKGVVIRVRSLLGEELLYVKVFFFCVLARIFGNIRRDLKTVANMYFDKIFFYLTHIV